MSDTPINEQYTEREYYKKLREEGHSTLLTY